jgi:hypothetical protein
MGDHELGLRLRQILIREQARGQPPDGRRLQALVADLCGQEQQVLLPPLRHLLLSPAFRSALQRTPPLGEARSRLRFNQELRAVFAPPLGARMEAVIQGLLGWDPANEARGSAVAGAATQPAPQPQSLPNPQPQSQPHPQPRLQSQPDAKPLDQPLVPVAASTQPPRAWDYALAGFLAGFLLLLALAAGLFWLIEGRSSNRNPNANVLDSSPKPPNPGGISEAAGSGFARGEPPAPAASSAPQSLLPAPGLNPEGQAPAAGATQGLASASGAPASLPTPPAPELPPSQPSAAGPDAAATTVAIARLQDLYAALSRQDFSAAGAYVSGEAADQFEPAFFRQFERVEVGDLKLSGSSATSISLEGVVTFVYPDGTLQQESRSFTLETTGSAPRVIQSAFMRVVRPRAALR